MPNARYYSSIAAATNLQVTANPGDTSIQVASSSGWPGSFPFIISLDYGAANEELVLATSGGPNIFQVTRAYDGTPSSTHNAGAVVRHVSSAIDFTDSRTHEASSTGVHGITGQFVDTLSVQTLANKTLTAPTINNPVIAGAVTGGATYSGATFTTATLTSPTINGTVAGNPTFSGNVTASGTTALNGPVQVTGNSVLVERANPTDNAYRARLTGDANSRFVTNADGKLLWGPGTTSSDAALSRSGVGQLQADANLLVNGALAASGAVTAGTTLNGQNLNLTSQTYTGFTPVWTGIGTATLSTNVGWYTKYGKLVYYEIYSVWGTNGSGTSGIQVQFPTEPFRAGNGANTTRQVVTGSILGSNGGVVDGVIMMHAFAGDSGLTGATIRRFDGISCQGNNMVSGTIVTIQGWYREV